VGRGRLQGAVLIVELRGYARIDAAAGRSGTVTIELTDGIEMADSGELSLDELFEQLERMPVPEGSDPYVGKFHVFTVPKGDEYRSELTIDFGEPIDLEGTVVDLTLSTEDFPRD
jgi:hypothetical protein